MSIGGATGVLMRHGEPACSDSQWSGSGTRNGAAPAMGTASAEAAQSRSSFIAIARLRWVVKIALEGPLRIDVGPSGMHARDMPAVCAISVNM